MKLFITLGLFLSAFSLFAQNSEKEIDEQVWKPFTKAITSQDVEGFLAVHSKDLIRAERNSKRVLNIDQYKMNLASWAKWKERNQKENIHYTFELRFTERISNGDMAYEVGYFKNEDTLANGKKEAYFGKFQVALRKENGIWKILVDSDSSEGGSITEKEFLAASPVQ